MRVASPPPSVVEAPVIDPVEVRWAAEAVASLTRQLDPDSVVAVVLTQAYHELTSLVASAAGDRPRVIGPVRVRAAA
jgi:hypothetical protein